MNALDALGPAELGAQRVEADHDLSLAQAVPLEADGVELGSVGRTDPGGRDLVDFDGARGPARLLRQPCAPVLGLFQLLLLFVEADADGGADRRVLVLLVDKVDCVELPWATARPTAEDCERASGPRPSWKSPAICPGSGSRSGMRTLVKVRQRSVADPLGSRSRRLQDDLEAHSVPPAARTGAVLRV